MTLVKTTYNRRSFLKVSTAAGGGLVLGFSWLASCARADQEEVLALPEAWFDINSYLKIGDNGVVTIYSPNPEIGQNVKTSMPMIIAEELDVDWKNVLVEQAGLDTGKYTRQLAGGSQSIRQGWQSLRMAGATARRMLMEAAAKQWNVSLSELRTDAGMIYHDTSKQSIGYGEIAAQAAELEIPAEVELKNPADFKIIGKAQKNVDGLKIVTGQPLFGLDVKKEGMLIAMIVHPPAFGMKLKSYDAAAVEAMPGIRKVVTINAQSEAEREAQWSEINAFTELVAIVGETTWQVMKAKKALSIAWEQVTPAEDSAQHEAELNRLLQTKPESPARLDGDPEAAFAKAAQIIERTYTAPFLAHNTMEPMNFFAHVSADKVVLEGPIQTPEFLRKTVADFLQMKEEQISVMMTRQGGGFGRRLYGNFGLEAALISKAVNAPVKLVYTREDDMTQGTYRPDYKVLYRAALDENKQLIGFHVRGVGTHGSPVFANRYPAGAVDNYLVENLDKASNISTGAWRAPRSNFIAGAEQSFLDEIAEAVGQDPIDFRLALFDRAIQNPVGKDNDYEAARYAGVLRLVREKSGWDTPRPGVHRGVAAYFCHNSYVAQVVDVVMKDNQAVVDKVWCAVDCGIVVNPEGAINQVEGGIVDGIGHAMYSAITFRDGKPEQSNFDQYRLIRHQQAPREIEVFFVENGIDPTGLGEPSLPPVMGALANALYKATGKRLYTQPFAEQAELLG
ncbi:MAG TPA: molybdopterin-dependent oxidoreductase [Saprospiraceae bacterium]|nr:molybdopterin-dependent oxidoreductase [Saprospiraceae bacterium]HMQ84736.1 molybdopterin-dependent oxidoreductase [Saprospiraceae bacterium]